jgi:selenide,water dikinase
VKNENVLVGASTLDDAGVFRLTNDRALVQTVDFFTPIVNDPFRYGEIAAANALSDVYAMGGRPLCALNIMGIPEQLVRPKVIAEILRGGASKAHEAGCAIIGGHTIRNPEPVYGLAVTGLVRPKRMLTNANARPGDLLVLTKPLGTGIATTAIKRRLASPRLTKKVIALMSRLNSGGAELAERKLVRAAVDVTGFGLLGHLGSMCRASGVGAEVNAKSVPAISPEIFRLVARGCVPGGTEQNLETANEITDWNGTPNELRILLADAQTSGGLLLCVRPQRLAEVQRIVAGAVIGRIIRSTSPRISVT